MRSIPPELLAKIKGQNQTIWNGANPKMSIQVSRAKDTVMDSTYWTTEIIREKEGIGDLSVAARRQKPYGRPNRLYNIYVDNGTVKTAIREYPDYQKLKWQYQFDVGTGTACAIAFDGYWDLYRNKWQMVTSENPWLFWVDNTGKLWTQFWNEIDTKTELATGVSKVKSIRGWRNINMPLVDQGVVAGYIKTDGKVYYRNYAYQLTEEYAWENERELEEFTGTAVNLNLFITNDYRMGFVIEDSTGKIHLYVTERAWAGMAIAPEFIQARVSGSIELIPIEKILTYNTEYIEASVNGEIALLYAMTDNDFKTAENFDITMLDGENLEYQNWGFRIRVTTYHDMTALDYAEFSLVDSNSTVFAVTGITKTGKKEYEFTTADFNNAVGNLTLLFATGNTKGEAGQDMGNFSITFSPTNLMPTFVPLPEVEVIWNE